MPVAEAASSNAPAVTGVAGASGAERVVFEVHRIARLRPHSVILMNKRIRSAQEALSAGLVCDQALRASGLSNLIRSSEYNGRMSPSARRHFKGMIDTVLTAIVMRFPKLHYHSKSYNDAWIYPTFVTLTLPAKQVHDDKTLREECFKPFLEWLTGRSVTNRKTGKVYFYPGKGVKAYFWVAETQKNGNVHFHLLIDKAVDWSALRQKWNECLQRLQYLDAYEAKQRAFYEDFDGTLSFRYHETMGKRQIGAKLETWRKQGQRITPELRRVARQQEISRQKKAFENAVRDGFRNPNSTDIHKIRSVRSVTAYVTKYMTKGTAPTWVFKGTDQRVAFEQEHLIQCWFELDGKRFVKQREAFEYRLRHNLTEKPRKRYCLVTQKKQSTDGITHFVDSEQPVVRKYDGRRLDGRIWGYARCLRKARAEGNLKDFELIVSSFQEVIPQKKQVRIRREPVIDSNLFGQDEVRYYRNVSTEYVIDGDPIKRHLVNPLASSYLDRLRARVPPEQIEAANRMIVGRDDIEVIPCREVPQHELLALIAPAVLDQYRQHFRGIFSQIWNEAVSAN